MQEQSNLHASYEHTDGPPLTFADLQPDVHLRILQWLQPCELGACHSVCTELRTCLSGPLLWYHVYCAKYRNSPLTPPPNFEGLLKETNNASLGLAGEVGLSDSFPWKDLVVKREQIVTRLTRHELDADDYLTETRRSGMIDLIGRHSFSHQQLAVLDIPVAELVLPTENARPIAYVEYYVVGGSSIGLVSEGYRTHNLFTGRLNVSPHVGWTNGSIGYHGDTGHIHSGNGWNAHSWGAPTFGYDPDRIQANNATNAPLRPDVVGVGVEPDARTVFFTKNGNLVGSIRIDCQEGFATDRYCYFAVCIHDPSDACSLNFGTQRFLFDVEKYSKLPRPDPRLQLSDNGEESEGEDDRNDGDGVFDLWGW